MILYSFPCLSNVMKVHMVSEWSNKTSISKCYAENANMIQNQVYIGWTCHRGWVEENNTSLGLKEERMNTRENWSSPYWGDDKGCL